jgi:hypothetical protein
MARFRRATHVAEMMRAKFAVIGFCSSQLCYRWVARMKRAMTEFGKMDNVRIVLAHHASEQDYTFRENTHGNKSKKENCKET